MRRWKVERTFPGLGDSRRPVMRYERHQDADRAFSHVTCLLIALRR
jgi:hypothetical protein